MIDGKEINADFQFLGNRVSSFSLETKIVDTKGKRVSPVFEYVLGASLFCVGKHTN